jgi:hypothetical protein
MIYVYGVLMVNFNVNNINYFNDSNNLVPVIKTVQENKRFELLTTRNQQTRFKSGALTKMNCIIQWFPTFLVMRTTDFVK